MEVAMTKPRLLDQVRSELRLRHYSLRTEEAYIQWCKRFILFHNKRHPRELGAPEITAFLTWLATERNVASSTQNQALSALLFLYRNVLAIDLTWSPHALARKYTNAAKEAGWQYVFPSKQRCLDPRDQS